MCSISYPCLLGPEKVRAVRGVGVPLSLGVLHVASGKKARNFATLVFLIRFTNNERRVGVT